MEEFLKGLKERFKSPILGNFIFSWLIINWKIPYVTFFIDKDSIKGNTKIEYIESIVDGYNYPNWNLFFFPALITLMMVIVYPWLLIGADMILLLSKSFYEKYLEKNKSNFKLIQEENKELKALHEKVLKDFKSKILRKNIQLDEIFSGTWNVEAFRVNEHNEFINCHYNSGKIMNDKKTLFLLKDLQLSDHGHVGNFSATITVCINDENFQYNFYIRDRDRIDLYPSNNNGINFKLIWQNAREM